MVNGKNKNYYKSKAKDQAVKCRVCLGTCLAQNYKTHLKTQHPEENSSDLRRHGEASLTFNLSKVSLMLFSCSFDIV